MSKKTTDEQTKIMPPKKIILEGTGAIACGEYKAGKIYKVEGTEADRLINVKGFRLATDADEKSAAEQADKNADNKKQEG